MEKSIPQKGGKMGRVKCCQENLVNQTCKKVENETFSVP